MTAESATVLAALPGTSSHVAEATGLSLPTVLEILRALKARGIVACSGNTWRVAGGRQAADILPLLPLSAPEIGAALGCNDTWLYAALKRLLRAGRVWKEGKRGGRWYRHGQLPLPESVPESEPVRAPDPVPPADEEDDLDDGEDDDGEEAPAPLAERRARWTPVVCEWPLAPARGVNNIVDVGPALAEYLPRGRA